MRRPNVNLGSESSVRTIEKGLKRFSPARCFRRNPFSLSFCSRPPLLCVDSGSHLITTKNFFLRPVFGGALSEGEGGETREAVESILSLLQRTKHTMVDLMKLEQRVAALERGMEDPFRKDTPPIINKVKCPPFFVSTEH